MASLRYWIFSPPYSSTLEMYERSSRSVKSCTNSSRSAGVRACQWRPSERRAVSAKSKISLAAWRTAARRSLARASFFSSGSSSSFRTRSICSRSWSIGAPASAGAATTAPASASATTRTTRRRSDFMDASLHLAEDVLRQQLLEVHRRLDLPDTPAGLDELVGAAGADAHEFLADQALGLDGRDRILLQLDVPLNTEGGARLVIGQTDRL